MRCTRRTRSPLAVGNRRFLPRRSAPASRPPSSTRSGGSKVLSVATCAGPARSTGDAATGSSSARRHASISGSSGTYALSMGAPISVVVRRGDVVEARHRVDAVAVQDGAVVAESGDAMLVAYLRSSAKPLQALPLVRARDDLTSEDVAIAAASHLADPGQLAAAASLLAKAPATEADLECGPEGDPPSRLKHNCSGKHAGMLALCRAQDWPTAGYRLSDHPVQRTMLQEVAAAADVAAAGVPTAVDGCGVQTFALPLERMAFAFSRLE